MKSTDIIIIGGGIVGLATAYNLAKQYPDKTIAILEKENELAFHQSGRNSGVLHTGIYYKPGSLKAQNCRSGKITMEAFCREEAIDYNICGKVIVATNESELGAMQGIYERGQANGVNCEIIGRERLLELEPHVAGIQAIHVPEAGIVDYKQVCQRFSERVLEKGNRIVTGVKVVGIEEREGEVTAVTPQAEYSAQYLINCAGIHSDRVTKMSGGKPQAQIVPFRGEYFELKPEAWHLCNSLIYPVPNPKFPFLGVHFTLMISGAVECGPNAVLAFAREGYHLTDVNGRDLWETLTYSGFRKLAGQYWKTGLGEMWRSANKRAFVKALQKLVPAIQADDLVAAPAGIRAQALLPDGGMMDDFAFQESKRILNVVNAPSPAATSSISIGQTIVEKLATHFS
ncbi:MAG: L-2-hydroxyglutarate oxidase [Chloroflexi bacterium]|nr:L-2-hydroxyglutarate oxidase [Chloroflexota bacterium]